MDRLKSSFRTFCGLCGALIKQEMFVNYFIPLDNKVKNDLDLLTCRTKELIVIIVDKFPKFEVHGVKHSLDIGCTSFGDTDIQICRPNVQSNMPILLTGGGRLTM